MDRKLCGCQRISGRGNDEEDLFLRLLGIEPGLAAPSESLHGTDLFVPAAKRIYGLYEAITDIDCSPSRANYTSDEVCHEIDECYVQYVSEYNGKAESKL